MFDGHHCLGYDRTERGVPGPGPAQPAKLRRAAGQRKQVSLRGFVCRILSRVPLTSKSAKLFPKVLQLSQVISCSISGLGF